MDEQDGKDQYQRAFDGVVKDLAGSTGIDADQVATVLKRLSFPQTLADYTRLSGARPRELSPNDLRVGVKVGRMLFAA